MTVPLPARPGIKGAKQAHDERVRVKVVANQVKELPVCEAQAPEVPLPARRADPFGDIGYP